MIHTNDHELLRNEDEELGETVESWSPRCACPCIVDAVPTHVWNQAYLKALPSWVLHGPWSCMTYAFLAATVLLLAVLGPTEASTVGWTQSDYDAPLWLVVYRWTLGLFLLAILLYTAYSKQYRWVYVTYTIQSFTLLTLRLLLAALCSSSNSASLTPIRYAADALRAPALLQASIVVSVWWAVLVPLLYYVLWDKPGQRKRFTELNTSPFLVLIHLLNLPIAAVDFLAAKVPLSPLDLWIAVCGGIAYLLFYLTVLDANGIHLYVILSPRSVASMLVYMVLVALYVLFFVMWNSSLNL